MNYNNKPTLVEVIVFLVLVGLVITLVMKAY